MIMIKKIHTGCLYFVINYFRNFVNYFIHCYYFLQFLKNFKVQNSFYKQIHRENMNYYFIIYLISYFLQKYYFVFKYIIRFVMYPFLSQNSNTNLKVHIFYFFHLNFII